MNINSLKGITTAFVKFKSMLKRNKNEKILKSNNLE